ncbi:MAG: hypothetical protein JXM70_04750 [Pirellulales bacterium]|nr:hypothetical protein [Pirellulales bacterium]
MTIRLKDNIWVWGNPEMATQGRHTAATFAQAGPSERAKLLGVSNIMMAGHGLPDDDARADFLTGQVAHCARILWEITADNSGGPPFVYAKRIAQIRRLANKFSQIEGVILDDMSSVGMDKGFKAQNIAEIRELLGKTHDRVKIWGVVYTMNLNRPGMNECIKELDVILLCEWFGRKVRDFEKAVAHCERLFPDKPIVLGTYLYDYGINKRMTPELLKLQYDIALKLFKAGRIDGVEITTIDNDADAVAWAADWIKQTGNQKQDVKEIRTND